MYTDTHIHTNTDRTTNLLISSNVYFVHLAEITSKDDAATCTFSSGWVFVFKKLEKFEVNIVLCGYPSYHFVIPVGYMKLLSHWVGTPQSVCLRNKSHSGQNT